jgi:hypothetical protein
MMMLCNGKVLSPIMAKTMKQSRKATKRSTLSSTTNVTTKEDVNGTCTQLVIEKEKEILVAMAKNDDNMQSFSNKSAVHGDDIIVADDSHLSIV